MALFGKLTTKLLVSIGFIIFASLSMADDDFNRVKIGIQGGISDIEWSQFDDDVNIQVYASYHFLPWIGTELAYTDLGSFTYRTATVDATSIHAALVFEGKSGFSNLDVAAKVGLYRADLERNCPNCATNNEAGETDLFYAVQLIHPFTPNFDVTAGWQYFNKLDNTKMNLYQIGLRFGF